jgi:hypothetical protein
MLNSSQLSQLLIAIPRGAPSPVVAAAWANALARYCSVANLTLANSEAFFNASREPLNLSIASAFVPTNPSPSRFAGALESGLTQLWLTGLPVFAAPTGGVGTALPTLSGTLVSVMNSNRAVLDDATALGNIAKAIDAWTRTVTYLPPAGPPVIPLT